MANKCFYHALHRFRNITVPSYQSDLTEIQVRPAVNQLLLVPLLLRLQHLVHEEVLELLVRDVDAELLEAVHAERLETVNVQDADVRPGGLLLLPPRGRRAKINFPTFWKTFGNWMKLEYFVSTPIIFGKFNQF